jgi:hypothetical protein
VDYASGYCEGLCSNNTGARKVGLGVVGEVLNNLAGFAVGEQESNIAVEILGEL